MSRLRERAWDVSATIARLLRNNQRIAPEASSHAVCLGGDTLIPWEMGTRGELPLQGGLDHGRQPLRQGRLALTATAQGDFDGATSRACRLQTDAPRH